MKYLVMLAITVLILVCGLIWGGDSKDVLAILLSPIIAVIVAAWLNSEAEIRSQNHTVQLELRKDKMAILKALMMGRINTDFNFVQALNIIDIVFVDSKEVRMAWTDFFNKLQADRDLTPEEQKDAVEKRTKLIEEIIIDLGYKGKITWEQISKPYCPKWLEEQQQTNNSFGYILNAFAPMIDKFEAKFNCNASSRDQAEVNRQEEPLTPPPNNQI